MVGADSHTCTYGALNAFSTGVGSSDLTYAMVRGSLWFKVPQSIKFVCTGKWQKWVAGKDLILYIIGMIGVEGARYEAMEFDGEAVDDLSIDSRLTVANMAIEAGAKNGIFRADKKTLDYSRARAKRPPRVVEADADARYRDVIEIDVSKIGPQVAFPFLPSNAKNAEDAGHIAIDQAVIGSCTNGRLEDLETAAQYPQRQEGGKGRALHHHPGHPGHLPRGP